MGLSQTLRENIPRRGILGAMMFLACMFSYVIRTNLSIIIVAMIAGKKGEKKIPVCAINSSISANMSWINGTDQFNMTTGSNDDENDFGERYEWGGKIEGAILAAYFCGVVPASIPSGIFAEKFGGSKVVAFATLIPALLNLLMPLAAGLHWSVVLILRFLMGFFGAAVYPALHAMIARWVPPSEKGMFVWTMQGGPFGTMVTFTVCGQVISALGWKAAYYVTSGAMLVFYVLWVYLIYDTPDEHPGITEEEKAYIKEKIGGAVSKDKVELPIKSVATSVPFLVLLWAHFANMWGIYFISTNGPKYTLGVLNFNMKSGGAMTGLPYIARLGAGVLFAAAGDYLRRKNILTVGMLRKSFMLFSHVGPAICLIGMTYAGCNAVWAIVMLILALALNGAACQTSLQNQQDLAPNYAGSLYGVMNTFGSFPGFIIPAIIGVLTDDRDGIEEWRIMFWLSSVIFASATVLFWFFGSAEIQSWNYATGTAGPGVEAGIVLPEEEKRMTNGTNGTKANVSSEDEEEENARL